MRVLHAYKIYRPDINGGIPEVIYQLTGLRNFGGEASVLTTRSGVGRTFEHEGIMVTAIASFGQIWSMPIAPTFPYALIRGARHCDVLALHAPFPLNDLGVAFGIPNDVAVVLHWHAEILGRGKVMPVVAPLIRRTLKRADRIIVTDRTMIDGSPFLAPYVDKCAIVPYGIEHVYWQELDEGQRQRADALRAAHPRLAVSIGRLVPYKGFPVLLHALQTVNGELTIIGHGSEHEHLLQLANELGVADRFKMTGILPRDDMKVYLHAAKLFVLPSVTTAEAFGIVQLEAMAAGLPVVNTNLPTAVPKTARHGIEGYTVPPNEPAPLTDAINRLLDNPELAAGFGSAGRQRVQAKYSKEVFLQRIHAVYSEAIETRRRTARC